MELQDQKQRDIAVKHRGNLFISAGAGTGKTYTMTERIIELVAPTGDEEPYNIENIAAITFTRRAAGEIRSRLRSKLLDRLHGDTSDHDEEQLRRALKHMDRSFIGTIHSFAERLLQKRPIEGNLSPGFTVEEDISDLVSETVHRFLTGCRNRTLKSAYTTPPEDVELEQIEETVLTMLRSGVPEEDSNHQYGDDGFHSLLKKFITTGGKEVLGKPITEPDVDEIHRQIVDVLDRIESLEEPDETNIGFTYLKSDVYEGLKDALEIHDPTDLFIRLTDLYTSRELGNSGKYGSFKARNFPGRPEKGLFASLSETGEPLTWEECPKNPTFREVIYEPLTNWMGARLLRVRSAISTLYEQVKKEYSVLSQDDILIKLRDSLRQTSGNEIRSELQDTFSHILVDEFQDTDPHQCEIVFYLSERPDLEPEERADHWTDVELEDNQLTLIGDPKQSIYRFRGADIEMFSRAVDVMCENNDGKKALLQTNFRSGPGLIDFYNEAYSAYLGEPEDHREEGLAYDPESGEARYEDVLPLQSFKEDTGRVDVLRYEHEEIDDGEEHLTREAEIVADYVEWLTCEACNYAFRNPDSPLDDPSYGYQPDLSDIAILARESTEFDQYLRVFSQQGIPVSVSGGSTFLDDRDVKHFVLALRAIADKDDGLACAALERPPFFATGYRDLITRNFDRAETDYPDEHFDRHEDMQEIVSDLRRKRLGRPPLDTAIDLIERSGLSRFWSTRTEGDVKLGNFYNIAARLDQIARERNADYDRATEVMREWVESDPGINPPKPDRDAVDLMTIHQAKGLEYSAVILFDGTSESGSSGSGTFYENDDGTAYRMDIRKFEASGGSADLEAWEERENMLEEAEEKRVHYVAATRAMDVLAIPEPASVSGNEDKTYQKILSGARDVPSVHETDVIDLNGPTPWELDRKGEDAIEEQWTYDEELDQETKKKITHIRNKIGEAESRLVEFTSPHAQVDEKFEDQQDNWTTSRHGEAFGTAVHQVLQRVMDDRNNDGASLDLNQRVQQVLVEVPEAEEYEYAIRSDVENALDALTDRILNNGADVHTEYPITTRSDGDIITGRIDLLVQRPDTTWIVDYKTDPAPADEDELTEMYPHYQYQVEVYKEMLRGEVEHTIKTALLFTDTGMIVSSQRE